MAPGERAPLATSVELESARRWLGLALSVLVAAGVCAVAVVIGRTPPFDRFVTDPLFFKRCLVAHVNFALVAWFYSFASALLCLVPGTRPAGVLARHAVQLAALGVLLMLVGAVSPGARPVLSNYLPTIDHALFQAGQLAFGLGVLATVLDRRLLGSEAATTGSVPAEAAVGLRAAAAGLVLAALTFVISWLRQTPGLEVEPHYELLFWGLGHVLQLVSTIAMISIWLVLLTPLLGASPVSRAAARALFLALLLPWSFSPLLALSGTWSAGYREGHTALMRWGLFPVTLAFEVLCITAVCRAWRAGRLGPRALADPRLAAFAVSAFLALLGFGLGALIRGSTTMVPAHYHASVGAVTVAFMAATPRLLGLVGSSLETPRLRRLAGLQPVLYGAGMALFAAGFALAGAHGMGRKVYGAEQAARGLAESIGLGVMGIGGFVAVAGGLLFLGVVGIAWRRGTRAGAVPAPALARGLEVVR